MEVKNFVKIIGSDFYCGVPDSKLKPLCNYLMDKYNINKLHHIITANEGNAVALAAGYYLSTKKIPVIYMQNSGEGNIVNPVASLVNEKVYDIPMIFVVGWRGEPGVHDEPQHVYQGEITIKLLDDLNIKSFIVTKDTSEEELNEKMNEFNDLLDKNKQVAFIIRDGALKSDINIKYGNNNKLSREEVINHIVKYSGEDPIISTTGKVSRELFEIREQTNKSHKYDFLTVGSMGHSSSIALGIAINKPKTKVWCIDGDGALLMHMGSLATIGNISPNNFIHILINNESHETVGGMPTPTNNIDFVTIAKACGYKQTFVVDSYEELDKVLEKVKNNNLLTFIEVKTALGSRKDLGRPTTTPIENKIDFMNYINKLD